MTYDDTPGAAQPPRFGLGEVVVTKGVAALADGDSTVLSGIVNRHSRGDWGDLASEDRALNEEALENGGRVQSAYVVTFSGTPVRLWVVTESDRSVTTILLPSEY